MNPQDLNLTLRKAVQTTQIGYFQVGEMRQGLGREQYDYPVPLETLLAGNSAKMALQRQPVISISKPITVPQQIFLNKTGATNGFSAYVVVIPSKKIGLVMLANRNFSNDARVKAAYATLQQILDADIQK